jgi:hypothetical protein
VHTKTSVVFKGGKLETASEAFRFTLSGWQTGDGLFENPKDDEM